MDIFYVFLETFPYIFTFLPLSFFFTALRKKGTLGEQKPFEFYEMKHENICVYLSLYMELLSLFEAKSWPSCK